MQVHSHGHDSSMQHDLDGGRTLGSLGFLGDSSFAPQHR